MEREKFGSRLGFILVSAGCAVGLGNVWKFPYMCGQYGGAAFILVYMLFLLILGFPILVCEFSVGRASQKSCAASFHKLEPQGTKWHQWSYFAIAGNYLLMMFYTMVAGWMLYYCVRTIRGEFTGSVMTTEEIAEKFQTMQSSPGILTICMLLVVALALGICSFGVQKGVEKITKIMMLCLLGIIAVLAIHSLTLPGSMAIFGSYLDKSRSLTGESISITLLDTFVAVMAGMIIIPACFAYGIEPGSGPSLVFITLPAIFNRMAGGEIWGVLFFVFLFFAALSTVIGVYENILSFAMDLFGWKRKTAVAVNAVALPLLSMPCILGFNLWSGIEPLGPGSNIMDMEDFLVSSNLLPLGAIVYVMFCTSRNGWGWDNFIQEANTGDGRKFPAILRKHMTYIIPVIVVIIYLKGYYDMFSPLGVKYMIPWFAVAAFFLIVVFRLALVRKKKA